MFILTEAKINKYKSYTNEQVVKLEDEVTTLVGKNESGKTAFLEALAKFNYFTDDDEFKFDEVRDYPRNELKKYQRSEEDAVVITCTFKIDEETIDEINSDLGKDVLATEQFKVEVKYKSGRVWYHIKSNEEKFIENLQSKLGFENEIKDNLLKLGTVKAVVDHDAGEDEELKKVISHINENIVKEAFDWETNLIDAYIIKKYLNPRIPRFWYFDEYHELPSRVSIESIRKNAPTGELTKHQLETAKALFELAVIDIDELATSSSFESFIAELEATSNEITDTIFEYWSTNSNLAIEFKIDSVTRQNQQPEKS